MRILFVHQNFPGQFKHLAPALIRLGHEVSALCMGQDLPQTWQGVRLLPYYPKRASTPGIHPWTVDFETQTIRGEAAFLAAMDHKAAGYTPDIIVSHPGWGESLFLKDVWPDAVLGIYCEFFYALTGADVGFDPEFPEADPAFACNIRLKNTTTLHSLAMADAAIAPTRWQADRYPARFRSLLSVVHDGIDTDLVAPNPNVSVNLGGGRTLTRQDKIITFVNRNLEPFRGYHIFMRALPEIFARHPDATVLLVGGSDVSYGRRHPSGQPWLQIFFNEVKDRIDPSRVYFLGTIPYDHFRAVLQLATVHVYLSYPFVLSWSLLEAMSTACPVVACDTAPVREVVTPGQNGLLVDFFDIAGLATSVCRLLDDPEERLRLGREARELIRARYDLRTVCLPGQLAWIDGLIGQRFCDCAGQEEAV